MNKHDNIDPRHYTVRADWVWSKVNPELTKVATLKVSLKHHQKYLIRQKFDTWLQQQSALKLQENEYTIGGCGITLLSNTEYAIQFLLFSGGQDALESLDELVQGLYHLVIRLDPDIEVSWQELPLHG